MLTNLIYWLFGLEDADEKPIMCINSLAPTNRNINYVMWRIEPLEDESEEEGGEGTPPFNPNDEAVERYFNTHY
jgi:hypothetical protein